MSLVALLTGAMKYAGSSFLEMAGRNSVNLCWEELPVPCFTTAFRRTGKAILSKALTKSPFEGHLTLPAPTIPLPVTITMPPKPYGFSGTVENDHHFDEYMSSYPTTTIVVLLGLMLGIVCVCLGSWLVENRSVVTILPENRDIVFDIEIENLGIDTTNPQIEMARKDARINWLQGRNDSLRQRMSSIRCPAWELENDLRFRLKHLEIMSRINGVSLDRMQETFESEVAVLLTHLTSMEKRVRGMQNDESSVNRRIDGVRSQIAPPTTQTSSLKSGTISASEHEEMVMALVMENSILMEELRLARKG